MELTAVIEALSAVKRPVPIVLHLDSSYVKNGITGWVHNWKRRGWRTGEGKPVKNVELWQALDKLAASHTIDWRWVKGHAGDPGNERADELANLGAAQATGRSV
jgi:ribonuclease H